MSKKPRTASAKSAAKKKTPPKKTAAASVVERPAGNTAPLPSAHNGTPKKRRLAAPRKRWYRPRTWRNSRPKPDYTPLPKARRILASAVTLMRKYPRPFLMCAGVYAAAIFILVGGVVASKELSAIKQVIMTATPGLSGKIQSSIVQYLYLIGDGSATASATGSLYQLIVLILCSLAVIWLLRELTADRMATAKDAFYKGMRPLVPFMIILGVIFVQLLPLSFGGFIYNSAVSGSLFSQPVATGGGEKFVAVLLALGLAVWSVRMLTASLVALYIVTLPDMTPLRALRHARDLVYKRRLLILRKVAYMVVLAMLAITLIELPVIFFATAAAPWVFFAIISGLFIATHVYLYMLYRELLK